MLTGTMSTIILKHKKHFYFSPVNNVCDQSGRNSFNGKTSDLCTKIYRIWEKIQIKNSSIQIFRYMYIQKKTPPPNYYLSLESDLLKCNIVSSNLEKRGSIFMEFLSRFYSNWLTLVTYSYFHCFEKLVYKYWYTYISLHIILMYTCI